MSTRPPTLVSRGAAPGSRARRGAPSETRRRLVAAAGVVFNTDGYEGTDSNRIARAAGYSPGTFYKHFADKQAIFAAVYDEWVAEEWRLLGELVARGGPRLPRRLASQVVAFHRRWRVFLRSLRELTRRDPTIRRAHLAGRRRQLAQLPGDRARNLFLLFAVERTADAIADGDPAALGVRTADLVGCIEHAIAAQLASRSAPRAYSEP